MTIQRANIESTTPGSSIPSNSSHAPPIASAVKTPSNESRDAEIAELSDASDLSIISPATSSLGANVNEQVAPGLVESLHPRQVSSQPSLTIDLEAQTAAPPQRSLTRLSESLNNIYTTNTGLFRLLGSVMVCSGVAFTLWQTLESRQHSLVE